VPSPSSITQARKILSSIDASGVQSMSEEVKGPEFTVKELTIAPVEAVNLWVAKLDFVVSRKLS
jgi:hypothetical protein